jgi:FkbM family methyltransferase
MMKSALRKVVVGSINAFGRTRIGGRLLRLGTGSLMEHTRVVEHEGVRLSFVAPNDLNVWRIESFSTKEPETLQWIDGFSRGSILWDIGANVGLYTCYAAKKQGCHVYAFEPSVFNLEVLARNVWLNELSSNVTIVPLPLTDTLANSTLNMTSTEWGGALSTFDKSYTHDGSALRKIFEFRTIGVSMDGALTQLGIRQPDYIKMDVDGIEHLILKGGAAVLGRVKGVLIEIDEVFEKQTVDSRGYLTQAGLVLKEKRHSEMFDNSPYRNCYNQIWYRPATQ